jgi:4'-phosphopantetheinyl transferase
MAEVGWLTRSPADVPASREWLGPGERLALGAIRFPRRRADWLLGRWAAKAAVASRCGATAERIEVIAAPDGAPEALLDGEPAAVALSLSHRAGRALAVVGDRRSRLGCDLELVEPRSDAFVAEWLAPEERALVAAAAPADAARLANLLWSAKEAAAKARREGLRLAVRDAVAAPGRLPPRPDGEWRRLSVRWANEGLVAGGWWREEPGWVFCVVAEPAGPTPVRLTARRRRRSP